jgi:hypothetical protein
MAVISCPLGGTNRLRWSCLWALCGRWWFRTTDLTAYTGLRRSEALGVRWRDVDLEVGTFAVREGLHHISKAAERVTGRTGLVRSRPKTDASGNRLPLSGPAVALLRDHHRNQAAQRLRCPQPCSDALEAHRMYSPPRLERRCIPPTWPGPGGLSSSAPMFRISPKMAGLVGCTSCAEPSPRGSAIGASLWRTCSASAGGPRRRCCSRSIRPAGKTASGGGRCGGGCARRLTVTPEVTLRSGATWASIVSAGR